MSGPVLMKCGCVAAGVMSARGGKKFEPPIPCCIVHNCIEPAEEVPTLDGRMARCGCGKKEPSSYNLPFFEYRGDGSRAATETCVCGYNRTPHWPAWQASIRVIRRWFKIERDDSIVTKGFFAPDEEIAKLVAEKHADFFRDQKHNKDTEVFEATVTEIRPSKKDRNSKVCNEFRPKGEHEFDRYYCGHAGWD
jgi:hypothetical protein